jgi:hypothetical protein
MAEEELKHTLALYAGQVSYAKRWIGMLLDRTRDLGM